MKPIPLYADLNPAMAEGDIVTIEGCWNRPPTRSAAWWAMLILGPAFAARHLGRAFRRKVTDPWYHLPLKRRGLFEPRKLQMYRITGSVSA